MEDNELYLMATLLSVMLILNGQKDNRIIKKWQYDDRRIIPWMPLPEPLQEGE